jgi:hypothetical protein
MAINFDNSNAGVITLKPGASGTLTLVLPIADGTSGQFLKTDGAGTLSFGNGSVGANAVVTGLIETTTITATALTATATYDVITQTVLYVTGSATNNWTLNVRGSGTTTLNSLMAINQTITLAVMVTNGATPFYQSATQIDGVAQSPKWLNAVAPSAGNANSIDVYTLTITKTSTTPTYNIIASQTRYA